MTFFLRDAPTTVNIEARGVDTPLTSFWGGVGAAFGREQLESNANFRVGRETIRTDDELAVEAARHMGADRIGQMVDDFNSRARAAGMKERPMPEDMADLPSIFGPNFSKAVLDAAREDPEWGGPDVTPEASEARTNERLKKEHRDLTETLNTMSGGARWIADIAGAIGGGIADVRNAPFLIAGGGTGSLARIMGREAMLNVAAEGATLPDRFGMAERLDIPKPDVAMTLAYAAAGGAILGGAVEGLARGITYWRGTRAGAPSERVTTFDQQLNADIAEDAIADLRHPFERVQAEAVETPAYWRLEDASIQRPLSGISVPARGERVTLPFDEWVQGPVAQADVRLPRSIVPETPAVRADLPIEQIVSRARESAAQRAFDDEMRRIDPAAVDEAADLKQRIDSYRGFLRDLEGRYDADLTRSIAAAEERLDQLNASHKTTQGKTNKARIRKEIDTVRRDLSEMKGLVGKSSQAADIARTRSALTAAESRLQELAPRLAAARSQIQPTALETVEVLTEDAPPVSALPSYDEAVHEWEMARRRASVAGRELDAALYQMPEAPGWVDVPKEREAVHEYRTDDLRTQIERDGDRMIGDRSLSSMLDELDADDGFAALAEMCGRRVMA